MYEIHAGLAEGGQPVWHLVVAGQNVAALCGGMLDAGAPDAGQTYCSVCVDAVADSAPGRGR
ncbi:hypothetical protein [Streptomyces sp. NRRL S-87]|uniref:hypothetical protein n=1 Tax=Streptomyces sp. NRRL S-87 TaxID=1463920 RepID=UPI0004BE74E4|nr:hypothetical protein [Streptomyces sp. NRRL S-87]